MSDIEDTAPSVDEVTPNQSLKLILGNGSVPELTRHFIQTRGASSIGEILRETGLPYEEAMAGLARMEAVEMVQEVKTGVYRLTHSPTGQSIRETYTAIVRRTRELKGLEPTELPVEDDW